MAAPYLSYSPDTPPAEALETITTRCPSCHGTGLARQAVRATCGQCGAWWSPLSIAAHFDGQYGGWWGWRIILVGDLPWLLFARLPCGHRKRHLDYRAQECRTCGGSGVITTQRLSPRYLAWYQAWLETQADRRREAQRQQRARAARYNPVVPPMRALTPRLRRPGQLRPNT